MADDPLAAAVARPDFTLGRLLLFVTGSINAALVPHWLTWLRHLYPDLVTSLVVTRSAERFVTVEALRAITTGRVWRDSWDEDLPNGSYMGLETEAEAFGIFPATLDCAMRLASGSTNTPMLMTLQCTDKPIGIASTFPGTNAVIEAQLARLNQRPNIAFVQTMPAFSLGKGAWAGRTGFHLPALLQTIQQLAGSGLADAS